MAIHSLKSSINNINSLEKFQNSICKCVKCDLGFIRNKMVFGIGNPCADIVFIGEAPGKNEDLIGEPFVGRSGKLLDKMLSDINLSREKIYICNVIKCRPPDNRDPLPSEIDQCEVYLRTQLSIIKPKLIVALGRIAACTILKSKEPLKNLRNQVLKYEGIDLIVTYHPAALLRNPNFKKHAADDFSFIRSKYSLKN